LEKNSHLLKDLNDFLIEINNTFGKTNKVQTATTKLHYAKDLVQLQSMLQISVN
jgi:hypothetical protein